MIVYIMVHIALVYYNRAFLHPSTSLTLTQTPLSLTHTNIFYGKAPFALISANSQYL